MNARTREQLRQTLHKREVDADLAERVLDRMEEVGLVDDLGYAQEYVRQRRESRGSGRRALAMELQRKGVPEPIINEVLEPVDVDDERNVARDLVRKKWRSVAGLEPQARRRRLAAILGRRGYSAGLSFEVIREIELENDVDSLDPADNPSLDR